MIDNYHLREIARVPFMLCIICQVLPKKTSKETRELSGDDSLQSNIRRIQFLRHIFVSETIKANAKKTSETTDSSKDQEESKSALEEVRNQNVDSYVEAIHQQTQNFALRSSGYSINERKIQYEIIDDPSLILKLHPFVKWDNNDFRVKFQFPFIREFYIAKSIAEEIREKVPSSAIQEGKLEIPRDLLINQRLLTYSASNSIVLFLLRDAVKDNILSAEQLMNLIKLSCEKGVEQENDDKSVEDADHLSSPTPFAVTAANAITVLNAAGYDFSNQNLSNISIPSRKLIQILKKVGDPRS